MSPWVKRLLNVPFKWKKTTLPLDYFLKTGCWSWPKVSTTKPLCRYSTDGNVFPNIFIPNQSSRVTLHSLASPEAVICSTQGRHFATKPQTEFLERSNRRDMKALRVKGRFGQYLWPVGQRRAAMKRNGHSLCTEPTNEDGSQWNAAYSR